MKLPRPPMQYDPQTEFLRNGEIERADGQNVKIGGDIILRAPDGGKWRLTVDNSGTLSAVAA